MSRIEQKFRLNAVQADYFRERMRHLTEADHALDASYDVFSIYFDTPELDVARDKLDGEAERSKCRLRSYSQRLSAQSPVFLEIKSKSFDDQTKLRIPLRFTESLLDPAQWYFLGHGELTRWLTSPTASRLLPICGVYFKREAFGDKEGVGGLRITMDSEITALLPHERSLTDTASRERNITGGDMVLEVKTHAHQLPKGLERLLREVGANSFRFSKYVEALQYLKFEKIYEGHFA